MNISAYTVMITTNLHQEVLHTWSDTVCAPHLKIIISINWYNWNTYFWFWNFDLRQFNTNAVFFFRWSPGNNCPLLPLCHLTNLDMIRQFWEVWLYLLETEFNTGRRKEHNIHHLWSKVRVRVSWNVSNILTKLVRLQGEWVNPLLEFKFCYLAYGKFTKIKFRLLLHFWESLNDSLKFKNRNSLIFNSVTLTNRS